MRHEASAEVTLQDPAEPPHVLEGRRHIEAEVLHDLLAHRFIDRTQLDVPDQHLAGHEADRDEYQERRRPQDGDREKQPPEDVGRHLPAPAYTTVRIRSNY